MWKSWYLGNSFTDIALFSMAIFMVVFVVVVVWAFLTNRDTHDARARLPLLHDEGERATTVTNDKSAPTTASSTHHNAASTAALAGGTHV